MTKEAKEQAKLDAKKDPTENKFNVGDVVRHTTPSITVLAAVTSLAWRRRPGTKSDTQWHYELDSVALNGAFVAEDTLSKAK